MPMYLNFPVWSDLGVDDSTSVVLRNTWDAELQHALKCFHYYSGTVFDEKVEDESKPDYLKPDLFPVGVNLIKMMCIAHADAIFGEYDDLPVTFSVRRDLEVKDADIKAIELANNIMFSSNAQSLMWELALNREIFGGVAIRITPVLESKKSKAHIRWSMVSKDQFFPIWDPDDPNHILEVYVVTPMTPDQAKAIYGVEVQGRDSINRIEHWTEDRIELKIGDRVIKDEPNTWRFVPFVYIPRFRSTNWWGEALPDDLYDVQDELNMRLADVGEALNYNAHPTRWGYNLPSPFNTDNYPLDPNAMWDLGRVIGQSPEPTVGILEAENPIPEQSFSYIEFLYDWGRTSTNAPPIAFGEDNGGGQRSGITLEIRLWPMIKAIRRSRGYLTIGFIDALKKSALILQQKSFLDIGSRELNSILENRITLNYSPVLPRDQVAAVDEVVKLLSTNPQAISLETAQDVLGRSVQEVTRIATMVADDSLYREIATNDEEKQPDNQSNLSDG